MAEITFSNRVEVKGLLGKRFGRRAASRTGTFYDYTILIGFKGKYPKKRGGVPVVTVARNLQDGTYLNGRDANGEPKRKYESGSHKIKRWKFVDNCIKSNSHDWKKYIRGMFNRAVEGKSDNIYDETVVLGNDIKRDIRETIIATNAPALEKSTIERKSKLKNLWGDDPSHPLIESGRLLNSIFVKVVKKKTADIMAARGKNDKGDKILDSYKRAWTRRNEAVGADVIDRSDINSAINKRMSDRTSIDSMKPIGETGVFDDLL